MDALNNQSINKIHWNDSLVIGIPEVDEQHKILLDIFNELISLSKEEDYSDKILAELNELKRYSVYHFHTEEEIMHRENLPNIELQINQHELFKKRITKFMIDNEYKNLVLLNQITTFLRKWLIGHIIDVDAKTLKQ